MKTKMMILAGLAVVTAFGAVKARSAATSRSVGTAYGTDFGGTVPMPGEYRAAAKRLRDERGAPQAVLLFSGGSPERAWTRAERLDDGNVLVELLPLDDPRAVAERARGLKMKPVDGLPYKAFADAATGRVTVHIVTPTRLVRVSAARWSSAFDSVVRGYRDAA
ncbi:MAG: hypothetical protein SF051_14030 [Elusimicrobiota bacterium]|nr:hypothetical protein [Elusimicrobiota bacterium]